MIDNRITLARLAGRKARVLTSIHVRGGTIPVGAIVTITGKHDGWAVESAPCDHCGIVIRARNVPGFKLELATPIDQVEA